MNFRKIKYSKVAVVVFLTILIWVWADLATDEELPLSGVTITMGKTRSSLWISFGGEQTVDINDVVLTGSVSKINDVKQIIRDPERLKFIVNAEQEGLIEQQKLPVRDFLRNSSWIRELGLTVESCVPETVDVNVVELTQRQLDVQCLGENDIPLTHESIEPPQVGMFVPSDWEGDKLTAYVKLTRTEIDNAKSAPIEKTPYIRLATGQPQRWAVPVRIKMPLAGETRGTYTIKQPVLGYTYSANTQGKYTAEVENENDVKNITVLATPYAIKAYEDTKYHVILDIYDDDINADKIQREVRYNFPPEFVRKDEIELVSPKMSADFTLVPVTSAEDE